jgi:hypothetical protein
MKHYTHMYIAHKGIEFLYNAMKGITYRNGRTLPTKKRNRFRDLAGDLQRILRSHIDRIFEASWAPDDIINDKSVFHVFKLFKADEFDDYTDFVQQEHVVGGETYYRAKNGGGLPYKVDHLARVLADMLKLRNFNDIFAMEQIAYQFFLLSHYIVDAHVPMHCDIRDDKPGSRKPALGRYYDGKWHGVIEKRWEDACTPAAVAEGIITKERENINVDANDDTPLVTFGIKKDVSEIPAVCLQPGHLMGQMIKTCVASKERNRLLFPVADPSACDKGYLTAATREIFSDAIGSVISVWMCIWYAANEGD